MIAGITKTRTVESTKPTVKKPRETMTQVIIAPVEKTKTAPIAAMCQIKCHVTDATQHLASVAKMTDQGNRVIFDSDRSYIQSKKTGAEMDLIFENGVYKLDVVFMNGENAERGRIVIDSGAADNVMPAAELTETPLLPKEQGVNFTSANGKPMANHGRRDVQFVPFQSWEAVTGYKWEGENTPFQGQAE